MVRTRAEARLREPLLLKLGRLRDVNFAIGLGGLAIGLVGTSFVFDMPILTAVMIPYLIGIMRYVVAGQEKEFDRLRYLIDCDDIEADRLRGSLRQLPRLQILLTWIIGPGLMLGINIAGPALTGLRQGATVNAGLVWGVTLAALFWVLAAQMILVLFNNSRTFGMLARDRAKIDLLDSASLVPFARVGIRNLLVYFGAYALLPLVIVDGMAHLPALAVSLAITIPLAILFMLIPILPVYRRIRQEKMAELDRIQKAMHGDRAALESSAIAVDSDEVGFTDLMLYRQMVEAVREWPVTTPIVLRLSVYVVIPLLTWFGAAIVEQFVGRLLP